MASTAKATSFERNLCEDCLTTCTVWAKTNTMTLSEATGFHASAPPVFMPRQRG
jgi:hypothetical protein